MKIGRIAATALLLVSLAPIAAAATSQRGGRSAPGELVVFLEPSDTVVARTFAGMLGVAEDGEALPVLVEPVELGSGPEAASARELTRASLPAGAYRALRFLVPAPPDAEQAPAPLDVELGFRIVGGETTTVFLAWGPGADGAPLLAARLERPQLRSLLIFVTNRGTDDLTVIQRDRAEVVGVVKVGREPMGIDVGPGGNKLYVANAGSDTISVVDTTTRRVLDTLHLDFGSRPVDVAVSPLGDRLYIASADRSVLSIFETGSLREIAEVEVGLQPWRVAVSPDGAVVYVANRMSESVSVVDVRNRLAPRVAATVPVESRPHELVVDPRGQDVFVAHLGSDGVAVLGASRAVARIQHYGASIDGLALDDGGRRLYLSAGSLDRLFFGQSRSESVTGFVVVPAPGRLALDPDGKKIYVLDPEQDRLQVVNRLLTRVEGSIPTGSRPYDLVLLRR